MFHALAHSFEHWVPSRWCCFGKMLNVLDIGHDLEDLGHRGGGGDRPGGLEPIPESSLSLIPDSSIVSRSAAVLEGLLQAMHGAFPA